jgi:uncharacterized glyoxalase superfamily protein PhnB
MQLGATLYIKNASEAVEFYSEAFGLTLGYHEFHPDGTYLHAELHRDGHQIFAVSESTNEAFVKVMHTLEPQGVHPTMTYGIDFANEDEVRKAYEMLARDGKVILPIGSLPWSACCAEVVDKYGVFWYITI